jgi:hypothetical protein
MRDGSVTPKVTLCDALEGEKRESRADAEQPGWLPFLSVSQDAETISSLGFLFHPGAEKKEFFFSV